MTHTVLLEAHLGGVWTDITGWWRPKPGAVITHGDLSGSRRPEAGRLDFELKNTDARFTEDNPLSPYWGEWGRGTLVRLTCDGSLRATCKVQAIDLTWPSDQLCVARVQAAGPLAELGSAPDLGYPLRSYLAAAGHVDYWPMEDGETASRYASATNRAPLAITMGEVAGTSSDWAGSAPLPILGTARLVAPIPSWTATGEIQVQWSMDVPASLSVDTTVLWWSCSGTARRWYLSIQASTGYPYLRVEGDSETVIADIGFALDARGQRWRMTIELTQAGSDIDWVIARYVAGDPGGGLLLNGTISARTLGAPKTMRVNPSRHATEVSVGHLSLHNDVTSLFDAFAAFEGFNGETVLSRVTRIAGEVGIDCYTANSTPPDSAFTLGVQRPGRPLDAMRTAAEPLGTVHEFRSVYALRYEDHHACRAGANETARWETQWASVTGIADISRSTDLASVVNTAAVSREGGGQATHSISTGQLGVDTIGQRGTSKALALHTDDQADWVAQWLTGAGTREGARVPSLVFRLHASHLTGPVLTILKSLYVGARITLTDPPAWCGPEPIDCYIEGYREVITAGTWEITPALSPAAVWDCGRIEDADQPWRLDTTASTLASTVSAGATSMSVTTSDGTRWTTDSGHFPLDVSVAGIRVTVTGISGTGTTQTFAVTGSTVTKALPSGSAVSLWTPARITLGGDVS